MTREFENDDIRIGYKITDETFDHAFGRERRIGFEIEDIYAYIPALKEWLDVSHMHQFEALVFNLIEKEMEKAA